MFFQLILCIIIQIYSTFCHSTHSTGTQLWGEGGALPCPFFENQKKRPNFGKKAAIFGLNFAFKM